ncbi:MAG: agmatine deiminase family protein [Phycisphaeraceae bacterium]|nr:agmatine deiminase family protein [Phycisphaeraceae bacterium]
MNAKRRTVKKLVSPVPLPGMDAADLGYRMPAEWEPQAAVWVTLPHNEATWPGCLDQARVQFERFIARLSAHVVVRSTQRLGIPTNDSWIRDYGAIFVVRDQGRPPSQEDPALCGGRYPVAAHSYTYNAWGGKYPPWQDDDAVPARMALALKVPLWRHDFVLEGGSIDVNGKGLLLTTAQCLLNRNRNPHCDRKAIERKLARTLNVSRVIWLAGGVRGDDTDGHIDDVARFISPDTIAAVRVGRNHPDFDMLEANWRRLLEARDLTGRRLNLVELPAPEPVRYQYPTHADYDVGRQGLPASYANFLISNGAVFVPVFGQKNDDLAVRQLEGAMPGIQVVPIRSEYLIVGMGAIHCMTMQEPEAPGAKLATRGLENVEALSS